PQEHAMYARSTSLPLAVAAALALGRCSGAGSQGAAREPVPTRSSDVVTLEELSRVATASTLFEALHALRPAWFRRNPTTLRDARPPVPESTDPAGAAPPLPDPGTARARRARSRAQCRAHSARHRRLRRPVPVAALRRGIVRPAPAARHGHPLPDPPGQHRP